MLLTFQEVELSGVQVNGHLPTLGIIHQGRSYYFESYIWADRSTAQEYYRQRLDNPPSPTERIILLETESGFRLCIHETNVNSKPYEEALTSISQQMRLSGQLKIADYQWGLRTYKKAFIGSEAVTWLADFLQISRAEATRIGQDCLKIGCFEHVLGENDFKDEHLFYRFGQDGQPERRAFSVM